jgi:PIN domain nuclease of toxin-antitoxin system
MPVEQFVPTQRILHGINSLPLTEADAIRLVSLPMIHKDPFDRMLICQAISGDLTLLTPDTNIWRYPDVHVE